MAIKWIKLPKYKEFSYQPRYYDQAREEMDERFQQAELDKQSEAGLLSPDERRTKFKKDFSAMRNTGSYNDVRRKAELVQYVTVLGLTAIMGGIIFIFMRYNEVIVGFLAKLMEHEGG